MNIDEELRKLEQQGYCQPGDRVQWREFLQATQELRRAIEERSAAKQGGAIDETMRLRPGHARGDARRDYDAEVELAQLHAGRLALALFGEVPHARGHSTTRIGALRYVRKRWPEATAAERVELLASAERAGLSDTLSDVLKLDGS
jgi:hypothetical protein